MRHALKVDIPNLGKRVVEVPGLGLVVNPGTYEVPEELLPQFKAVHGVELADANFQVGVEYIQLPDQQDQDDEDALKSNASIPEKTQEEVEAEFETAKADNASREAEKKEGDN
jgi:hypothetical protein